MASQEKTFKLGLGATIVSVFVVLIVLTAGLIGYISFRNGQKAVKDLAGQTLDTIQNRIEEDLHNFLSIPHALNRVNAAAFRDGLVDTRDFTGLRKRYLHQIRSFDSVMACAFGSEQGEFIGAGRRSEEVFDSAIADKSLDNDYRVYILDKADQPGELVSVVRDYTPRSRPWYQAAVTANGPAWSPIYIWASETNIGISAVMPVQGREGNLLGVQQAALSLGRIGHFLQSVEAVRSGLIFIVEPSGALVASSASEPLVRRDPGKADAKPERVRAAESAHSLIRATAAYVERQFGRLDMIIGKERAVEELDGQTYFLSAVPIADDHGLDWIFITLIPEGDLMGPLRSNIRATLLAGIAAVIGAILLGFLMTRWITRPITQLGAATQEMSRGRWEKIEGDIRIKEVSRLAASFNRMADQLQESFATIEHRVEERTRELAEANELLHAEIAERKRVEEALRKSEIFLNATGRMAKVGGWEIDAETLDLHWTEQTYRIHEVAPDYKPSLEEAMAFFYPEDQEKLTAAVQQAIDHGEPYDMEVRFVSAEGRHLWARTICQPKIVDGKTVRLKGTFQDITERKLAEDERFRLERELYQAQKAESLGRMAGAIAHHFNNLLQVIGGNLELAMLDLPRESRSRAKVTEALATVGRAADISRLMLSYLGQGIGSKKPVSLGEICREALPLLSASLPSRVSLRSELPEQCPVICADPVQIRQTLINLVVNASEAIGPEMGQVVIAVAEVPAAKIETARCYPPNWRPAAERYACLSISDTGGGIDPENLEKIFDPFFSTKFTGRGLGLATVLGVVKAHEGAVTVESAPERGAVFRLFLPLTTAEADPSSKTEPPAPGEMEKRGPVLLVENETMLRKMVETMLGALGYDVVAAADGIQALEALDEHRDRIECVILDLSIPRRSGWETLSALRQQAPGIPVILTGDFKDSEILNTKHPERPQAFLQKPYRMAELKAALDAAMKQRDHS